MNQYLIRKAIPANIPFLPYCVNASGKEILNPTGLQLYLTGNLNDRNNGKS